jgi:hypothetical protein
MSPVAAAVGSPARTLTNGTKAFVATAPGGGLELYTSRMLVIQSSPLTVEYKIPVIMLALIGSTRFCNRLAIYIAGYLAQRSERNRGPRGLLALVGQP